MDFTAIEMASPRLILKAYRDSDAAETFAAVTPSLCRHMSIDPAPDLAAFVAVGRSWHPAMAEGREAVFTLRRADDGFFLGLAGLHEIAAGAPEAGIWIRESEHAKGYGLEAEGRVVAWAGDILGFPHVYHTAAVANEASRRLALRLGGLEIAHTAIRRPSGEELPAIRYRIPANA
jgi:RimJ/RimL family protein N-acetyltransferase